MSLPPAAEAAAGAAAGTAAAVEAAAVGAAAAGAGVAASVVTETSGLVVTDGFRPGTALQNGAVVDVVVTWGPFTREQLQTIRDTRTHSSPEPPPGIQIENPRSSPASPYIPPVKPHSNEPVRVAYFTGHSGTRAAQYPAEFSRQLARQYEALSYITVADYIKYRDKTARAKTPDDIKEARDDLRKAITENLVYLGLKNEEAQDKASRAVGMLAALHEPDQILQGTHALAATEVVWGNRYVNASLGPQHTTNATLLDKAAQKAREENREEDLNHYYLNVEVVLCENPTLAEQIRQDLVTITPTTPEHTLPGPYTSMTIDSLTQETLDQTTPTRAPPPIPAPVRVGEQTRTESTQQDETTERATHIRNILKASFPKPPTPTNPTNPNTTNKPHPHLNQTRTRTTHNKGIER